MYYPCSENKGADQLRGYREADLRLCFRLGKNPVFSRCSSFNTGVVFINFKNKHIAGFCVQYTHKIGYFTLVCRLRLSMLTLTFGIKSLVFEVNVQGHRLLKTVVF